MYCFHVLSFWKPETIGTVCTWMSHSVMSSLSEYTDFIVGILLFISLKKLQVCEFLFNDLILIYVANYLQLCDFLLQSVLSADSKQNAR